MIDKVYRWQPSDGRVSQLLAQANEISGPVEKVLVPEVTPSALAPGLPPVSAPNSKK